MADINIGSDQLLTTTLIDNDRITITRAETGQQVATMTVGDFRKILCGMDYSVLTEREVPGEYWVQSDGVTKKQVYTRTFVFTPSANITLLASGIYSCFLICGYATAGVRKTSISVRNYVQDAGLYYENYEVELNQLVNITVKYTKA